MRERCIYLSPFFIKKFPIFLFKIAINAEFQELIYVYNYNYDEYDYFLLRHHVYSTLPDNYPDWPYVL